MNFQNQNVIITGGASGIGLATARAFVSAQASVFVLDSNPLLSDIAESIGAHSRHADVIDLSSLTQAFESIPIPSVVVINAGIVAPGSILSTSRDTWNRILSVNLQGAFQTLQVAAQAMLPQRTGSIVLTASTNSYDGEPDLLAYNASKAGLLGLLHTAANELGPYGIRVNAVCPGLIRTPLTAQSFANAEILSSYFKQIPLGRGGEPEEVAQAILFLASSSASYITGATLLVDGGQMCSKFGTWGQAGDGFDGQQWHRK